MGKTARKRRTKSMMRKSPYTRPRNVNKILERENRIKLYKETMKKQNDIYFANVTQKFSAVPAFKISNACVAK